MKKATALAKNNVENIEGMTKFLVRSSGRGYQVTRTEGSGFTCQTLDQDMTPLDLCMGWKNCSGLAVTKCCKHVIAVILWKSQSK